MANSITHGRLPYPVRGARFTLGVPFLNSSGTPADPTSPDTEVSIDGAAYGDCTNEATTISGGAGSDWISLTGDETNGGLIYLQAKSSDLPTTLAALAPRELVAIASGTAQSGSSTAIKIAAGFT